MVHPMVHSRKSFQSVLVMCHLASTMLLYKLINNYRSVFATASVLLVSALMTVTWVACP